MVFGCPPDSSISPDTLPSKLYSYPHSVHRYEDAAIQLLCMPSGLLIRETNCEPLSHSFLVTRSDGSKYYGVSITMHNPTHSSALFVSRAMVLVSDLPFYSTMRGYLEALVAMLSSPRSLLTFESYIFSLINTATFPNTDCILRLNSPTDTHLYAALPSSEDLPVFELGYLKLCRFLNPSNVVKVVTCILLEYSIIIQSDNLDKLNYFCESLTSLIYPFFWTYPYVPILPSTSLEFLDAPLPFIIGWHSQEDTSQMNLSTPFCRIDVSTSTVQFSDHYIPQLPFSEQLHQKLTSLYNQYLFSNSKSLETSENHVSSLTELMSIVEDISNIRIQSEGKLKVSDRRETSRNTPPREQSKFEVFSKEFLSQLEFDCQIRNTFYSLFLNTFSDVAKFIIRPNIEGTSVTRTFDKIAFLSDKTTKDREFLSQFFETQMFTKFIDDLIDDIISPKTNAHSDAKLFMNNLRNRPDNSNLSFPIGSFNSTCDRLISRAKNSQPIADSVAPVPTEISTYSPPPQGYNHAIPDYIYIPMVCPLDNESLTDSPNRDVCIFESTETELVRESEMLDYPHLIAVELSDLLKQARIRIKQLITHHVSLTLRHHYEPDLKCSDAPRIIIGHRKYSSINEEDKGLISNLIDALETIWRHGYKGHTHTEGSYLWEHILALKHNEPSGLNNNTATLPVADAKRRFRVKYQMPRSFSYTIHGSPHKDSEVRRKSLGACTNPIQSEVQYILEQENIMTDSGRVRMWVKLLLEKQSLSMRVKELLSLRSHVAHNYHRSAFLCTDNELEQLVYHLDSLSCVEFSCFTNDFTQSQIKYNVTLSFAKSVLKHTSVLWLVVSGTLGRTDVIRLDKGSTFCCFSCRNIGHILGVRIGHDNGGISPDVFVNTINITNSLTGHLYTVEANRNLSDKQKDDSVEYYLSAGKFLTQNNSQTAFEGVSCDVTIETIKSRLQDSIRDVIHYFTEPRLAVHSLTHLILGKRRFISCLVDIMLFDMNCVKNQNSQLWAYFSNILVDMKYSMSHSANNSTSHNKLIDTFSQLQDYNNRSGPIEKIHVLLVTALSHQILHEWVEFMSESKFTSLYYRESAFLLNTELREFVYGAVATLRSYNISTDRLFTLYID